MVQQVAISQPTPISRLNLASKTLYHHPRNEFFGCLVVGEIGVGKSSYASRVLAQDYGEWEGFKEELTCVKHNYEAVKKRLIFLPEEFLDYILGIDMNNKEKALLWDDASYFLYSLDNGLVTD